MMLREYMIHLMSDTVHTTVLYMASLFMSSHFLNMHEYS